MRDGLDAPTESVSEDGRARLLTYFDTQSTIALAVWVNALTLVSNAAREAGIHHSGLSAGIPTDPRLRTTVLFDTEVEP